jgi:hypothetical protein
VQVSSGNRIGIPLVELTRAFGGFDDRIGNSGTITGSIDLGEGRDTIVNTGSITGNIRLGAGDDAFTQRNSGTIAGTAFSG